MILVVCRAHHRRFGWVRRPSGKSVRLCIGSRRLTLQVQIAVFVSIRCCTRFRSVPEGQLFAWPAAKTKGCFFRKVGCVRCCSDRCEVGGRRCPWWSRRSPPRRQIGRVWRRRCRRECIRPRCAPRNWRRRPRVFEASFVISRKARTSWRACDRGKVLCLSLIGH